MKKDDADGKQVEWANGVKLKCGRCKHLIAVMAPGTYGQVSLWCPWCGQINDRVRSYRPWSEIWKQSVR